MERSSPLAVRQPDAQCKMFAPKFRFNLASRASLGYFGSNPVRGSSPTASLAADLSQNMHIDQSPSLPTPRRALFSGSLFFGRAPAVTTPPISSSPSQEIDMSPLPHKPPFVSVMEVESPVPVEMDLSGNMPAPVRRRSHSRQLSRVKSTSNARPAPKFTFQPELTLDECFNSSPPQDKLGFLPQDRFGLLPPRPKLLHSASTGRSPANVIRRSNLQTRPKRFCRTQSMFEHAEDVEPKEVMDIDTVYEQQLPHFVPVDQPDSLPRITGDTLVDILDGKYGQSFEKTMVIDCRFEYEFDGGHIQGAVNFNDKESLGTHLFAGALPEKTLLVFHCEYSAHRAPIMAKYIRHMDRSVNEVSYPKLTFPELYILDGGYSSFFKVHPPRCFPQSYVEMDAKEHAQTCEREMGKLRQRTKLHRAQTYSMGQRREISSPSIGSPTTIHRSVSASDDMRSVLDDFDARRAHTRRMASY